MIALVTIATFAGVSAARRGSDANTTMERVAIEPLAERLPVRSLPADTAAVLWVADGSPMFMPVRRDADSGGGYALATVPAGGGVEQWRSLVAAWFPPDEVDKALRVLWCESRGDAGNISPYGDSGLFQIAPRWHYDKKQESESWFDPTVNVRVAHQIWLDQGWLPWPYCGMR